MYRIFECPVEPTDVGPVAVLPSEKFRLPREKRIPDVKPLTRWEKFAKEKGIKKKKRERMVYDDIQGEFRPRYGYKRANDGIEDMAIVEVKSGQDPMADPWSVARAEKKNRVLKNEKNQIQNNLRAVGKRPSKTHGQADRFSLGYLTDEFLTLHFFRPKICPRHSR